MLGLIKTLHLVHVRGTDQSSVEPVGPGVIGTLNSGRVSGWFLTQPRPAVATDIVKTAHAPAFITHNNQAFTRYLLDKIISRSSDLTLMPHQDPLLRKNGLTF